MPTRPDRLEAILFYAIFDEHVKRVQVLGDRVPKLKNAKHNFGAGNRHTETMV